MNNSKTDCSWSKKKLPLLRRKLKNKTKTIKLLYQANIQVEQTSSSHNDLIVLQLKLTFVPRGNRPISSCRNLTQNLLSKAFVNLDLFFRQNLFPKLVIAQDNARFKIENIYSKF